MLKRAVCGMFMAAIMLVSALAFSQRQTASGVKSGYAQVNGLKMYYEVRGTGQPLILLHGGVGSTGMFSEIMPGLASSREVIALDLQAHGRTADIARPLSYEATADDVAALMKTLEIKQADVMGYSLGGGVALRTAIQHPELVRKLVVVSAPFKARWLVSGDPGHDVQYRSRECREYEAVSDVSGVCKDCTQAARLASAVQKTQRTAAKELRLVQRGSGHQGANIAGGRGCGRHSTGACSGVFRTPRRREKGCGLGWSRDVGCASCDPAGHNALQHFRVSPAGDNSECVFGRADAG